MKPATVSINDQTFVNEPLQLTDGRCTHPYTPWNRLLFAIVLLGLPTLSFATHIVGGQLEMVMTDKTAGRFQVKMIYYYNEAQTANLPQPTSNVVIFRKADGKQMAEFILSNTTLSNRPPIVFANPACAISNNLRISQVIYQADIQLDINTYNDPQGYYMIQQNCCRNANITNINTPQSTPFLFYLEFPALEQAGQPFINSSPTFLPLNGEYICLGTPFTFSTVAVDSDGDELRYSLVSPLMGTFIVSTNTAVIKPAPYPEVSWKSGYTAQQAIPGNPALAIDQRSGILSVTASQVGLYVFSVRVEEFRRGVKLGEIRRDLQLLVLDCPKENIPKPTVQVVNRPVNTTSVSLCNSNEIRLETTNNQAWNYQWTKNSIPISGATLSTLAVTEPGDYAVTISLASGCSPRVSSEKVLVKKASEPISITYKAPAAICRLGGSLSLTAPTGYTYRWFRNGTELQNQTTNTLTATQTGQYTAMLFDIGQNCTLYTDTIAITQRPDPVVTITSATTLICPGDSLRLLAGGAASYQWLFNGTAVNSAKQASFYARTTGSISVMGTDTAGCMASSSPVSVSLLTNPAILFTPIPTICGTNGPAITLTANPAGGSFAGKGVSGSQFNPAVAGIGNHELTYTLPRLASNCANPSSRQQVEIALPPVVGLPAELTAYKGGTVDLQPILTGQPVRFLWEPSTYLSFSDKPATQAINVQQGITYTLTVTGSNGCQATGSVRIRVIPTVGIPDAFTPNGDGLNDTWQLTGIEAFPDARLMIFNRWGTLIYQTTDAYSRPFDGTLDNQALPTGLYAYVLHLSATHPPLKGFVLLVR